LLSLIRKRCTIENQLYQVRDAPHGEVAHRYTSSNGAPVLSFLIEAMMNLLRRGGYHSIRQSLRELAFVITSLLALARIAQLLDIA